LPEINGSDIGIYRVHDYGSGDVAEFLPIGAANANSEGNMLKSPTLT
jgi:hypothetical protein